MRSLCVDERLKSKGVGRTLTEALLDEAERYGLKTVFALTVVPAFFEKLGFRMAPRERFPVKVYEDCLGCPKYSCCDEVAVSYELAWRRTEEAEVPRRGFRRSGLMRAYLRSRDIRSPIPWPLRNGLRKNQGASFSRSCPGLEFTSLITPWPPP